MYNPQTGPTKSTQFPDSVKVGVRRAARLGFKERAPKEKSEAKDNDDGFTKSFMTKMHMGKKDKEGSDGLEGATAEERERAQAEAANRAGGQQTLRADSRETESEESAEDEEDEEVPLL